MGKIKLIAQLIIGLIVIAVVLYFLNIENVIKTLTSIDIRFFVLAMCAYVVMNALMAFRLKIIFKNTGKKISLKELLLAQFGGMLASDVTPGRSGYLILPFLIKDKVPLESGFSAIFGVQIIDFSVKILGSVLAVIFLSSMIKIEAALLWLVALGITIVIIFASLMAFMLWSKRAEGIICHLVKIPIVGNLFSKLVNKMCAFQHDANKIKSVYPQLIGLTALTWIAKGFEWTFLGMALGFSFPFYVYMLLQPLITILQFVPISPAGLGFQESGGMIVFLLLGVPIASAFVFNLLARIVLIIPNIIGIYPLTKKGINVFDIKE
jgi:hypothetical protein